MHADPSASRATAGPFAYSYQFNRLDSSRTTGSVSGKLQQTTTVQLLYSQHPLFSKAEKQAVSRCGTSWVEITRRFKNPHLPWGHRHLSHSHELGE